MKVMGTLSAAPPRSSVTLCRTIFTNDPSKRSGSLKMTASDFTTLCEKFTDSKWTCQPAPQHTALSYDRSTCMTARNAAKSGGEVFVVPAFFTAARGVRKNSQKVFQFYLCFDLFCCIISGLWQARRMQSR